MAPVIGRPPTLPSFEPVDVATPCAGRWAEWDWSALHGDWALRRSVAEHMCAGCPLGAAACATRALGERDASEMVWAGVPVPPRNHRDYPRAMALLDALAGLPPRRRRKAPGDG